MSELVRKHVQGNSYDFSLDDAICLVDAYVVCAFLTDHILTINDNPCMKIDCAAYEFFSLMQCI